MKSMDLWVNMQYKNDEFSQDAWLPIIKHYVRDDNILVKYNNYGKPRLANIPNIFFNVAHSLSCLVVGVSNCCEIGIDIDIDDRRIVNAKQIASRFFHIDEINFLTGSINFERNFIYIWLIKEAFVKMKGVGITYGLSNFIVNLVDESIFDIKEQEYFRYNLIKLNNNFVCCVVPKFSNVQVF